MNLPEITSFDVSEAQVILRADLDVSISENEADLRLQSLIPIINYLSENKAKTVIIGHRGRPKKGPDEALSLKPVADILRKICGKKIDFLGEIFGEKVFKASQNITPGDFLMLENLRFDPREEKNDPEFAKTLLSLGKIYVNEAFGTSHRKHTSLFALPQVLKKQGRLVFFGPRFIEEVKNLEKVLDNPKRPLIFVISGVKKDKLGYIGELKEKADRILVGGRLPEYIGNDGISVRTIKEGQKIVVANLIQDKEDITVNSIEVFEGEIEKAGTVVLSGPLGKYEDEGHSQGTRRIFEAVSKNKNAFRVAGGGDTVGALSKFGLEGLNWVSDGGGAMLEFLAKGTLPAIEAIL